MGYLFLDEQQIGKHAIDIESAGALFKGKALSSIDTKSTLSALGKGRKHYNSAVNSFETVGNGVVQQGQTVSSLLEEFIQFDTKIGVLNRRK